MRCVRRQISWRLSAGIEHPGELPKEVGSLLETGRVDED